MGSLAGIVAGLAVVGGAVALARFAGQRLDKVKGAFNGDDSPSKAGSNTLDYEKDPDTGVFRPKED